MQLTPAILIAGESAAASAVDDVDLEHHVGLIVVVLVVLWNRGCNCCCKLLLLGVPLLVKLVDVEIAVRSTDGLMLKADVVVKERFPQLNKQRRAVGTTLERFMVPTLSSSLLSPPADSRI